MIAADAADHARQKQFHGCKLMNRLEGARAVLMGAGQLDQSHQWYQRCRYPGEFIFGAHRTELTSRRKL
jgi:hypothetical protein